MTPWQTRRATPATEGKGLSWSWWGAYLPKTASSELEPSPQATIISCILTCPPLCPGMGTLPLISEVPAFHLHSWVLLNWLCASIKVMKPFNPLLKHPLVRNTGLQCCWCSWQHHRDNFPAVLQSSFPGRGIGLPVLQKGNFKPIKSSYCSLKADLKTGRALFILAQMKRQRRQRKRCLQHVPCPGVAGTGSDSRQGFSTSRGF